MRARNRRVRIGLTCLAALLAAGNPAAQHWPQWRGPGGHGVSDESNLPVSWSRDRNLAWQAALAGLGTSSPIVRGDRVYVTTQVGRGATAAGGAHPQLARDDRTLAARENPIGGRRQPDGTDADVWLVVEAFERATGRRAWEYRTRAAGPLPGVHEKHNLATPTPVADGERVYAWFGNGQLVALDTEGRPVWTRHLGREYAPFETQWGHGSSPTLYGDLLILLCDHLRDAYLLAVDARTGREVWKADRGDGRVAHSTPLVVPGPNGDELLVNSSARIDAYDPRTGRLLWYTGDERQTPIPSAVFHDGVIFSRTLRIRPKSGGVRASLGRSSGHLWRGCDRLTAGALRSA
jgi:outer membrane protein assembly factor BamB